MEGKEGDEGNSRENGEYKSEEPKDPSFLRFWSVEDEDEHINGLDACTSAIDCWNQKVVFWYKGKPIPKELPKTNYRIC